MSTWEEVTQDYYDRKYVLQVLKEGAKLGVDTEPALLATQLAPNKFFVKLSKYQTRAVTNWLVDRVESGGVGGPFQDDELPFPVHTVPIFTVPKPELHKYRVIQDFSYKYGQFTSINDHIPPEHTILQYISKYDIARMMQVVGPDGYAFSADVAEAFYVIPLAPSEYPLMGFKWGGKLWIFKVLGMGVASSPRTFSRVADAIEYAIVKRNKEVAFIDNVQLIRHYADDFFGVASDKATADKVFSSMIQTMSDLNTPAKVAKNISPTKCIKLVGEILELRSPRFIGASFQRIYKALCYLVFVKLAGRIHKKQYEKLNGVLNCIAQLKFPAKAFLRRFQARISDPRLTYGDWHKVDEFIELDIDWWIAFVSNPVNTRCSLDYFLRKPDQGDHQVHTDAAGKEGLGGVIDGKFSFQIRWSDTIWDDVKKLRPDLDIQVQEYLGSVVAMDLFSDILQNSSVTFYNDNPGAAGALISKAPRLWRSDMQCLTRNIAMLSITNNAMYWGIKINGDVNEYADALSRFKSEYDWNALGFTMRDPTDTVNKYLNLLAQYPPNRNREHWAWSEEQKEMLRINATKRLINKKQTHRTKSTAKNTQYNILTRTMFDEY